MTDNVNDVAGTTTDATTNEGQRVTVSRVIEAPPDRVYAAYLDPDELAEWLPPTGFSGEVHELDPVEGGGFRMSFIAETEELEPHAHSFHGTYLELTPGEKIVHTDEFESEDPSMAGEMTVTVTFEADPDGTRVTVHQEGIPVDIPAEDAKAGWTDSLGNLARVIEHAPR